MPESLRGGLAYFALVFAVGFVIGTLRVLLLVPRLGEQTAVVLELPIMLAISWMACRLIIRRCAVPERSVARLLMGGVAFGLLMTAELGISIFAFNRSFAEHLAVYATAPAMLGLLGQIAFALFPVLQMSRTQAQRQTI